MGFIWILKLNSTYRHDAPGKDQNMKIVGLNRSRVRWAEQECSRLVKRDLDSHTHYDNRKCNKKT